MTNDDKYLERKTSYDVSSLATLLGADVYRLLVRERGWTGDASKEGLVDTAPRILTSGGPD
jgi:hypothetical protein